MARLAKVGIKPGANLTTAGFDAETRKAIDEGMIAGQQAIRVAEGSDRTLQMNLGDRWDSTLTVHCGN